jgi:hypothetical protein
MMHTINDIINIIQLKKNSLGITLYNGATSGDLSYFEKKIGVKLPDDVRAFYSFCNGFESEEDMFRIIPLNEIMENCNSSRDTFLSGKSDFHFAEYLIYCDMWTLSIDLENNNDYFIYNTAQTEVTLTKSLPEFLSEFLNGGVFDGLYKWREKLDPDRQDNTESTLLKPDRKWWQKLLG